MLEEIVGEISDLGKRTLELRSGFSIVDGTTESNVQESGQLLASSILKLGEIGSEYIQIHGGLVREKKQNPNVAFPFSLRLADHDMVNSIELLNLYSTIYSINKGESNPDSFAASLSDMNLPIEELLSNYDHVRLFSRTIAYLSTSQSDFITKGEDSKIPASVVKLILENMLFKDSPQVSLSFGAHGWFSSDEYVGVVQLVKNAKKHGYGGFTQEKPGTIFIRDILMNDVKTLNVRDYGNGIASENLPKIFDGFTTNGTGVGLQTVKQLTHMKGGFVDVLSTQGENEAYLHSTVGNNNLRPMLLTPHSSGTSISLYFPNQK